MVVMVEDVGDVGAMVENSGDVEYVEDAGDGRRLTVETVEVRNVLVRCKMLWKMLVPV
jgi:hypothetical protein